MAIADYLDYSLMSDGTYRYQPSSERMASMVRSLVTFDWVVPQHLQFSAKRISYFHYATIDHWWVICRLNGIVNPYKALACGRTIKIATTNSLSAAIKQYSPSTSDSTGSEAGSTVSL